jgi:hypothetical protein
MNSFIYVLFMSSYSVKVYSFILHIWSSLHSGKLLKDLPHSVHSVKAFSFIPCIWRRRTAPFHRFGTGTQTNPRKCFLQHFVKPVMGHLQYLEIWSSGELLDRKSTRNSFLYCSSLKQQNLFRNFILCLNFNTSGKSILCSKLI